MSVECNNAIDMETAPRPNLQCGSPLLPGSDISVRSVGGGFGTGSGSGGGVEFSPIGSGSSGSSGSSGGGGERYQTFSSKANNSPLDSSNLVNKLLTTPG